MANRLVVKEPYDEARQQHEADTLGMYLFLASEIMLFGGLIAAILINRLRHPQEFAAASERMHLWIGAGNTVLLLTSSLLVALAVQAARAGRARRTSAWFAAAALLGLGFLALKALEYGLEYEAGLLPHLSWPTDFANPFERLFMNLYLIATGLHALHLTIGIAMLCWYAWRLRRGRLAMPQRAVTVEMAGLYWHLVDVVWIVLYPLLYLAR